MPEQPEQPDPLPQTLARLAEALDAMCGVAPEGLTAEQAARYCGVSVSKWHSMNAGGACPAPVELGDRCPRWLRSELFAWLRQGAPSRAVWRQIREQSLRRSA